MVLKVQIDLIFSFPHLHGKRILLKWCKLGEMQVLCVQALVHGTDIYSNAGVTRSLCKPGQFCAPSAWGAVYSAHLMLLRKLSLKGLFFFWGQKIRNKLTPVPFPPVV